MVAYCPYCGEGINSFGDAKCPDCASDIRDIWELLGQPEPASPKAPKTAITPPQGKSQTQKPTIILALAAAIVFGVACGVLFMKYGWPLIEGYINVPGDEFELTQVAIISTSESLNFPTSDVEPSPEVAPTDYSLVQTPLFDGQIIFLKCLGHEDGSRWLSADVETGVVSLAQDPNDSSCRSCWVVVNPDNDGVIELQRLVDQVPRPSLLADPQTDTVWVGIPNTESSSYLWEARWQSDGAIALVNLSSELNTFLDGHTVISAVSLAPEINEFYTGARWEVSLIQSEMIDELIQSSTQAPEGSCLDGSRLQVGIDAYVIEGGGRNRLRRNPSLNAKIITLIDEGKRVQILEGPRCNGNIVWWRVRVGSSDTIGWTAEMRDGEYFLSPNPGDR